jgi:hypothetical protein
MGAVNLESYLIPNPSGQFTWSKVLGSTFYLIHLPPASAPVLPV